MNNILIEDIDDDLNLKNDDIKNKNMKKRTKKKKIKKLNIYLLITSIIWIFLIILNTYLIFKYDVLPFKYLLIYLGVIVILPILLLYILTRKKVKRGLKVFISVIGIFYIIILSLVFFYLNKTFSFLDSFTSGHNYETNNYVVMVLNDSDYDNISDLADKRIGYVDQVGSKIDQALEKLGDEISFKDEEYKEYDIILNDLDDNSLDAALLEDAYYQMLGEDSEDFYDKYKVIYRFSITEMVDDITKDVDVTKDTFNIYISGIDSYGNVNSLTRSDVNIVVSINPKTNQILMINIPRDYYVKLHDTDSYDKLTHAGIYGVDVSVSTIEDLLDMEINYYLKVNYNALVKLVDALGGVDVYSKYSFTTVGTNKNYFFTKGYNHVNGTEALYFVRTRKAFEDGDRVRGENQQAMIQAIIKKGTSNAILTRYTGILNSLTGSFITNISTDKITDLVKMQLDSMPSWNITSISLSGSDGLEYTYTYPYQELYVMIPDEETVTFAKESLEKVKAGEILDSSYTENTGKVNTPTLNSSTNTSNNSNDNQTTNENINSNPDENTSQEETEDENTSDDENIVKEDDDKDSDTNLDNESSNENIETDDTNQDTNIEKEENEIIDTTTNQEITSTNQENTNEIS